MSFAELTAIGNVGKSPEVRYSPEGKKFCHFS
jgi:single-stranded DNA-binding protein